MAGLNENGGFDTPTWAEIISEVEKDLQQAYDNPQFTVEDNENFGQLVKIVSERESRAWQAQEQVYRTWTRNGAEGDFLDELYALNGIFREGATAGVGDAVVETNESADNFTPIDAGTLFSGVNGIQYATAAEYLVSDRVVAYKVNATNTPLNTYNFTVQNRTTGVTTSASFTLNNPSTASRLAFLGSIKTFLQSVNSAESNIQLDEQNLTLYYGFNTAYDLKGLLNTVDMAITPSLGNRFSLAECVATTTGFNPLSSKGITSMSPVPIGYVSVTNITPFATGTEIETDAAFIERAEQLSDGPRSCTRPAIISGLLENVQGIDKVSINKVVEDGVVKVTPIVIGGETADIAEELYKRQGINNIFSGNVSYVVDTLDNKTEEIRFSRGETQQLAIRVTYRTTTNVSLTENEQNSINTSLVDLSESWQLGSKIFNFTLMSATSGSVATNKFSQLLLEAKKVEEPDSAYTSQDYQALPTELPDLITTNISYRLV